MVGLAQGGIVKFLKIHCPPWFTCLFRHTDHPSAPISWGVNLHLLQDPQSAIPLQLEPHLFPPVDGHGDSLVYCLRCGALFKEDF